MSDFEHRFDMIHKSLCALFNEYKWIRVDVELHASQQMQSNNTLNCCIHFIWSEWDYYWVFSWFLAQMQSDSNRRFFFTFFIPLAFFTVCCLRFAHVYIDLEMQFHRILLLCFNNAVIVLSVVSVPLCARFYRNHCLVFSSLFSLTAETKTEHQEKRAGYKKKKNWK